VIFRANPALKPIKPSSGMTSSNKSAPVKAKATNLAFCSESIKNPDDDKSIPYPAYDKNLKRTLAALPFFCKTQTVDHR
jgi:hypothetical protein